MISILNQSAPGCSEVILPNSSFCRERSVPNYGNSNIVVHARYVILEVDVSLSLPTVLANFVGYTNLITPFKTSLKFVCLQSASLFGNWEKLFLISFINSFKRNHMTRLINFVLIVIY